jgi:TonB family protein
MMTRTSAFLVVAVLTITSPCPASDPQSFQLVQRAAETSNIRITEVGPFRLRVRVHVNRDQPIDADYLLIWAAPDQWREEISTGNDHAIRIGGRNTVSIKSDSEQTQAIRSILRSLDVPAILYVKPNQTLGSVKNRNHEGNKVQCLSRAAKLSSKNELCFDAVTSVLVKNESGDSTTEFSKFAEFKGKQFPWLVTTFGGKKVHDLIEVEELTGIAPDSSLFSADAQYKTVPGCEHPVVPTPIRLPDPEYPAQLRTSNPQTVKLSATVNETGAVEGISVVRSAGALDAYAINALRTWTFAPATCGAIAVPFQFFTDVTFRTY